MAEKKVVYLVYLDAGGKEVSRKVKGRGHLPRGAEKTPRADGHYYVLYQSPKIRVQYVDLDEDGKIISREDRKQGRTKKGYFEMTDAKDPLFGHMVKVVKTNVPSETATTE